MLRNIILVFLVLIGAATQTRAEELSCRQLAETAAMNAGVPQGIMAAITVVESGRGDDGWPWTLNVNGEGRYFDSRDAALSHLEAVLGTGETRVDIGCMQLNVKWHGKAFTSASDMLDPLRNTTYAAYFLAELYKRTGSWDRAIATYHHSDPKLGADYLAKVAAVRGVAPSDFAAMDQGSTEDLRSSSAEHVRQIGILVAGEQALVPVRGSGAYLPYSNLPELSFVAEVPLGQQTGLTPKESLPPRLARRWKELEQVRAILAAP